MQEIIFRYLRKKKRYYIDLYKDNTELRFGDFERRPKTTRFQQYTGLKDEKGNRIFEGDIVRLYTNRKPIYETKCKSKYDKRNIECRATIIKRYFGREVDIENDFNNRITALKGKEKNKRILECRYTRELQHYNFFQDNEFNKSENRQAYRHRIEVIGNIHENKELLD